MLHKLATAIMKRYSVRVLSWKKDRHPIIYFDVLMYFQAGREFSGMTSETPVEKRKEVGSSGNGQSGKG